MYRDFINSKLKIFTDSSLKITIAKRSVLNQPSVSIDILVDSTVQEVLVSVVGHLVHVPNDTLRIENPQGTVLDLASLQPIDQQHMYYCDICVF